MHSLQLNSSSDQPRPAFSLVFKLAESGEELPPVYVPDLTAQIVVMIWVGLEEAVGKRLAVDDRGLPIFRVWHYGVRIALG
jgi:hypothetical protein